MVSYEGITVSVAVFLFNVRVKDIISSHTVKCYQNKLVEMGVGYDHKKYFLKQKKKEILFLL